MAETVSLKRNYKDMFLPSLMLILVTAVVFAGFYLIKSVNDRIICQITDVAGEETNPTLGRLVCCLIFFAVSMTLIILADRIWKKDNSKMLLTWIPATLGGTLLWTAIGECSWHFGFKVLNDEGDTIFASFPRIESIQGLPFFILGALVFVACFRKLTFPFASYILAE